MSTTGDAYARRASSGCSSGRGSIAGWTLCPLCSSLQNNFKCTSDPYNDASNISDAFIKTILSTLPKTTKSVKLFTHGRGLASHLHAVHTPWSPGKAELKRRMALQKRLENEQRRLQNSCQYDDADGEEKKRRKRLKVSHNTTRGETWEPSEDEMKQWNRRVVEIVALVESEAKKQNTLRGGDEETNIDGANNNSKVEETIYTKGRDRSGNICSSYRDSLPPFLAAASDGDLDALQKCIGDNTADDDDSQQPDAKRQEQVRGLLSLRDRNGSTAEHWAAGGGHIHCVAYLLKLRDAVYKESIGTSDTAPIIERSQTTQYTNKSIRRRRDGKTSLHYAARNGHNNIIDLLLSRNDAPPVDIRSGDGTTPLHMACYGGHPSTVMHLVETHNADIFALNDWECGASHWAAMSLGQEGSDKIVELCEYLKKLGVDFTARQKQGHAPLHKASSKKNRAVIEWLAKSSSGEEVESMGLPDVGDNSPSDIWLSVGGEKEFGLWMKDDCGW